MYRNTEDSYGVIARLFHWLIFFMVMGAVIGAAVFDGMPNSEAKATIIGLHKSAGVAILFLVTLRLLWRWANIRPRDLGTQALQNKLGHLVHVFLYILLFIQPVVGILMSQSFGHSVQFLGWVEVPQLVGLNPERGKFFAEMHEMVAVMLLMGIGIHVAAALKHHVMDKDRTLMRMLVGK